jgi:hypothetical protein
MCTQFLAPRVTSRISNIERKSFFSDFLLYEAKFTSLIYGMSLYDKHCVLIERQKKKYSPFFQRGKGWHCNFTTRRTRFLFLHRLFMSAYQLYDKQRKSCKEEFMSTITWWEQNIDGCETIRSNNNKTRRDSECNATILRFRLLIEYNSYAQNLQPLPLLFTIPLTS